MPKKPTATIERTAKSGRFAVRNESGKATIHQSGKNTPKIVKDSIAKNSEALRRLADR